ncbi:MAG: hypothetical protein ACE3L7_12755 [Candidatus Pristimantibacillus sp.]
MDNKATLGKKKVLAITGIMLAIITVLIIMLYIMIHAIQVKSEGQARLQTQPSDYTYELMKASNGMELHVLKVKPSNITLTAINNNVALTPNYGINGGFFYEQSLLSIAIVDSIPVNGAIGDYGSGNENAKYARGTLVWDGARDELSVQVVSKASELKVKDHTRFWAQGGISMSINDEANWAEQAALEQAPFPDEDRLRSGAVYDRHGMLYLVVSSTKGSLDLFRDAILEQVGGGQLEDGIFLDGDGSSQLQSADAVLTGDNRPVVQMMQIIK